MSGRCLRQKPRISYCEPEEPNFDEYIYCDLCGDNVYEYCSVHGPLLVIPDNKVGGKSPASFIPRAALTIPDVFLYIAPSSIPGAGLGVFATLALPSGVRFGPYTGEVSDGAGSYYCWQIYDADNKPHHCIDAMDPNKSNWMRYVNCARHWTEQNLVAFQYQGQLYYRIMSGRCLRQKPRISYCEPEEPNFDEYIYCDLCGDNVYEYCSVHGPLLVIPDNKVGGKSPASFIPRAALTIPDVFLYIAPSSIPGAGLGVFATLALPSGVRFGPYTGEVSDGAGSYYCWQIYDADNKPHHCIDAMDPNKSNWMRYVNCARHWTEQNLVAFQYQGQLYYRTVKLIPRHKELLVFYGSEFANQLGVDLSRYNSDKYATLCAPVPNKVKESETLVKTHPSEAKPNKCEKVKPPSISFKDIANSPKLVPDILNTLVSNAETQMNGGTNVSASVLSLIKQNNEPVTANAMCVTTLRTHTGENPYACTECGKKISRSDHLKSHMRTHTGEKPYACTECDNKSNTSGSLKIHMRTHTGEKPYACTVCGKKISRSDHLKRHMRTHTGEKPYACTVCGKKISRSDHLKRHMRTHTGEKPYACTECDNKSNTSGSLKIHMRTHTGEKPYACTVCGKKISRSDHLKRHMRTHTGEKPYACTVCGKKISRSDHLKRHMRTHTGEKPYACKVCDNKFSESGHLKRHMRTHTGEKPYACKVCDNKFSESGHLKRHMRTHTGEKKRNLISHY